MLKSFIAGIIALLAATFGMHHAPAPAPVAQSTHSTSAQLSAAATPAETASTTTPHFQDLSSQPHPASQRAPASTSISATPDNADSTISPASLGRTISSALAAQLANPLLAYATKGDLASSTEALQSEIAALGTVSPSVLAGLQNEIAQTSRINNLSNITVSGISGLTASDIPALSYVPLSGGTITGNLTVSGAFTGGSLSLSSASTSMFSVSGPAFFGSTATSSFASDGSLTLAKALGVPSGGMGTTTWQTGSIPFFNGTNFTENNSNLFWDNTNGRLGIGSTTPDATLAVNGSIDIASSSLGLKLNNLNAISFPASDSTTGASIAIGPFAMAGLPASAAYGHTAIGYKSLGGYSGSSLTTGAIRNTALGFQALRSLTSGQDMVALGYNALVADTSGLNNVAVGWDTCSGNTTGNWNVCIGHDAGSAFTSGNANVYLGEGVGFQVANGSDNTIIGGATFENGGTAGNLFDDTIIGGGSVLTAFSGNNSILIGAALGTSTMTSCASCIIIGSGIDTPSASMSNFLDIGNAIYGTGLAASGLEGATLSSAALIGIGSTTPWGNFSISSTNSSAPELVVGSSTATSLIVNDLGNVGIGTSNPTQTLQVNGSAIWLNNGANLTNIYVGSNTSGSAARLNWDNSNVKFNLGMDGTNYLTMASNGGVEVGTNVSGGAVLPANGLIVSGNVGIGTTSPYSKLEVWGPDTGATTAFTVVSSASTTELAVADNGNATLTGCLNYNGGTSGTCLSDERVKQDINPFNDGLSEIISLNPVTYEYNGLAGTPNDGNVRTGLIAQQVQAVASDLVATTSALLNPTDTTPTQLLEVNYSALTFALINAIKDIANISGDFETNLIAWLGNASNGIQDLFAQRVHTKEICDGPTCVSVQQLAALLASQGGGSSAGAAVPGQGSGTPRGSGSSASATSTTDTPPIIQINGDNPAIVQVGATYSDLGATIEGPQADLNLGITTYLNGVLTSPIQLDTSQPATNTIQYVATDQSGLTATSTRMVIIQAPISSGQGSTATSAAATTTSP